ncbi:MAG: sulfatase [Proteobacteria bacterium]|jgi:arylsulfatase A-like enzyme|nr:sulfatase [Pseudomonadota bacterium]
MPTTARAAPGNASPDARRGVAIREIAAAAAAWIVVALVEAIVISRQATSPGVPAFGAALRVALSWTLTLMAPVWIFALVAAAAAFARGRARTLLVALAAAALATITHVMLAGYRPFRWHPPFLAAAAVLAAVLALGHLLAARPGGGQGTLRRALDALWPLVGIGGFAAAHAANLSLFRGGYPTLHLALLLWAGALLQLGLFALAARVSPRRPNRVVFAALAIGIALALPAALAPSDLVGRARIAAAGTNTLGEARRVFFSFDPASEDALKAPLPPEEDTSLFRTASNLPPLPEGFALGDYNVLFITAEATRYDQTSLHDPGLRTTPTLAALAGEGAYSFSRAYSPSSGTLHAISSVLCMTYPSMIRLETWQKAWHGRLSSDEETVPELLAGAGYDTFLVSHDHKYVFHKAIRGFEQGFASKGYVYESGAGEDSKETDARVADLAVAEIGKRARALRPFFGWIFLASPHSDYFARYGDMPAGTDLERYRHELRFMDEQLGRIVDALRDAGLLERTVLVFAGDHGEEFREHGGTHHKATVYSESTRVPLVVRIPGARGGAVREQVSTMYLFPWLAQRGPEPLARAAAARVREEIGPMLRATDGAVVIELVGHDRMMASLVYERDKINYDFITHRISLFDLSNDPLEQRERLAGEPGLEEEAARKVHAYSRVRAAKRRYTLSPDQETPR